MRPGNSRSNENASRLVAVTGIALARSLSLAVGERSSRSLHSAGRCR